MPTYASEQGAPAACKGFLLVTFGTVGALTGFEFSESGPPPFKFLIPNCKKVPCDGQEQEQLVNIAPPPPLSRIPAFIGNQ